MAGQLEGAVSLVDSVASTARHAQDRYTLAAATIVQAELLDLNCESLRAHALLNDLLQSSSLPNDEDAILVLEHNVADLEVESGTRKVARAFYRSADKEALLGVNLSDALSVAIAEDATTEGSHYLAISALWREVNRTHRQMCWRPHRWALRRLGSAFLSLQFTIESLYYVIASLHADLADAVAEQLINRRSPQLINNSIEFLLDHANLQRHFQIACKLIVNLADGIPDAQVDVVADWILNRCSIVPACWHTHRTLANALEALEALTPRLSGQIALKIVDALTRHFYWTTSPVEPKAVFIERKEMVNIVKGVVDRLPQPMLADLTMRTLPLSGERKHDHDFADVIGLLGTLAYLGGESLRTTIGEHLFPENQPIPYIVLQLAAFFGKSPLSDDRMARAVTKVAQNISNQVQRVRADEVPSHTPPALMTLSASQGDERINVHVVQSIDLFALARNKWAIKAQSLAELFSALLTAIQERENFLGNRASMIQGLGEFVDRMDDQMAARIVDVLYPLAKGEILGPTVVHSEEQSQNPLNRYKINTGTKLEVRAMAIKVLGDISCIHSSVVGSKVDEILEESITDEEPIIRQSSFVALQKVIKPSEAATMAVLLGTRDPDVGACACAFGLIAQTGGARLTRSQWRLLLCSCRFAIQSFAPVVRRAAAAAIRGALRNAPTTGIRSQLLKLQQSFAVDICWSVRRECLALETTKVGLED